MARQRKLQMGTDALAVLSRREARRLAIASQRFGPRPARPSVEHIRTLAAQLFAFQIDSVNVLARAHYVPAFARLGPYPMDALDSLAYRSRELFEYWGHAASLMPISIYPLLRYRMRSDIANEYMRTDRGAYLAQVYAEVAERGPIAVAELSNPGKGSAGWWQWGIGKRRSSTSTMPDSSRLPDVAASSASTTFPNASFRGQRSTRRHRLVRKR